MTLSLYISKPMSHALSSSFSNYCRLGVTSLPFGHIYHPTGGLVEETKMSKKHFANFARVLKSYVNGLCDVQEHDELELKIVALTSDSDDEEDSIIA